MTVDSVARAQLQSKIVWRIILIRDGIFEPLPENFDNQQQAEYWLPHFQSFFPEALYCIRPVLVYVH